MPGPGCPLNEPIKPTEGSTTLIGALDKVVEQVPGLAWIVIYDRNLPLQSLQIGLLCPDGATITMTVYP